MESTQQQRVSIPRTNQKYERVPKRAFPIRAIQRAGGKSQIKSHPIASAPSIDEFTPLSQKANPFNKYQRELRGARTSRGKGGAAAAVCAMPAGFPCCPEGQSREMMSGALPPLLVMTPASARPEELTCVLLSWWLVEVMMLPGVLLVKVEVRLSKNIGGQYCESTGISERKSRPGKSDEILDIGG